MATKEKKVTQSATIKKRSLRQKIWHPVAEFFVKITAPIRNSHIWKFLRKYILRSPFRGYFVNSWMELRKVTWPNRKTAWKLTFTVIVFSAIFALFTTALDYGFERLARELFLK